MPYLPPGFGLSTPSRIESPVEMEAEDFMSVARGGVEPRDRRPWVSLAEAPAPRRRLLFAWGYAKAEKGALGKLGNVGPFKRSRDYDFVCYFPKGGVGLLGDVEERLIDWVHFDLARYHRREQRKAFRTRRQLEIR
jgi:hypothetical protein